jgi:hypothetical protein
LAFPKVLNPIAFVYLVPRIGWSAHCMVLQPGRVRERLFIATAVISNCKSRSFLEEMLVENRGSDAQPGMANRG